jgi:hypothetical protein
MRCDASKKSAATKEGKNDRRPARPNADLTTPDTTQTHTLLCTFSPSAWEETGLARCRRWKNLPAFFTFCSYLLNFTLFPFLSVKLGQYAFFLFLSLLSPKTCIFFVSSVLWRGVPGALTEKMRTSRLLRFVYGEETEW